MEEIGYDASYEGEYDDYGEIYEGGEYAEYGGEEYSGLEPQ